VVFDEPATSTSHRLVEPVISVFGVERIPEWIISLVPRLEGLAESRVEWREQALFESFLVQIQEQLPGLISFLGTGQGAREFVFDDVTGQAVLFQRGQSSRDTPVRLCVFTAMLDPTQQCESEDWAVALPDEVKSLVQFAATVFSVDWQLANAAPDGR